MAGPAFGVAINGQDNLSDVIARVNKSIASVHAPAKRLAGEIDKFAQVSGLKAVAGGFDQIARSGLGALASIARIIEPLGLISGAASVAGMYKLATSWGQFGTQLGFAAQRLMMAAGTLQALQGGAELAGVSADALTQGLMGLSQTLYDTIGGRNAEAAGMFRQLGIAIDDGTRHAIPAEKVLRKLADAIHRTHNANSQAAIAKAAGAGEGLLPFLRLGAKGIDEYEAKARFFGVTNERGVESAFRLQRATTELTLAVRGFGFSIAETVAPYLTPFLENMAIWIGLNRNWIAQDVAKYVRQFGDYVKSIHWSEVVRHTTDLFTSIGHVVNAFGGLETAIKAVIGIRIASWTIGMLGGINPVTLAVLGLTAAYIANSNAYDDFVQKRKGFKSAAKERQSIQDRVNALPPDKRAEFDRLQAQHGGHVMGPGASVIDQQRRAAGLPSNIGGSPTGSMQQAMAYFKQMGWTSAQSAGIVANIQSESGFNPARTGDGGAAYGIGQWHPDRQAAFARFSGHDIRQSTFAEQLAFYNHELTYGEDALARKGGRLLQGFANDPYGAGAVVSRFMERPRDVWGAAASRGQLADKIAANDGKVQVHVQVSADSGLTAKTVTQSRGPALKGPARVDTAMSWV